MLTVVTWFWAPLRTYRSQFSAEHVNVLAAMVRRNFPHDHEFCCVTDQPKGLDSAIRVVPAWNDFAAVQNPLGAHQPSCYRRLRAFHPEIGAVLGERFVSLDLDTVIVGDLSPVWNRPEDFVIWGETDRRSFYNGSMWLMTAGARPRVWTDFDPHTSPQQAAAAGKFGSDQGWLSYCLGPGEATWTTADGVYSYNVHLRNKGSEPKPLPADARLVCFHGGTDPWSARARQLPWVRRNWRK